jgi:mycothiol synthase
MFSLRPASLTDAPELSRMLTRCTERYLDRSTPAEEAVDRITQAGPEPERTAVIAVAGHRIVGFGNVWPAEVGEVKCFARVDPDATGQGIGSALLDRLEAKATTLGTELTATQWAADEAGEGLLRACGFEPSRYFLRMAGDLAAMNEEEPPPPPGIAIRALRVDDEEALYDAWATAFATATGQVPESRADWWRERRDAFAAGYDPGLWLVAFANGAVVGFAICKEVEDGRGLAGYVSDVGVVPARRGQGLAAALLWRSFRTMRERGLQRVALDVDAENKTSALRLYRKVGLREKPLFTIWAKHLAAPRRSPVRDA